MQILLAFSGTTFGGSVPDMQSEETRTDFVRHYLTQRGRVIRETDVYTALKATIDADNSGSPIDHLKKLARYSEFYAILLRPEGAPSPRVRERLTRLNRLEVTVAYPFLLSVYADHASDALPEAGLVTILDTLENFIVRRFVCGVPTHGLNKIFAPLYDRDMLGHWNARRAVRVDRPTFNGAVPLLVRRLALCLNRHGVGSMFQLGQLDDRP